MIQLYTKSIDGTYEKVNWNLLKVIPICKLKEAINYVCWYGAGEQHFDLTNKLKELGFEVV